VTLPRFYPIFDSANWIERMLPFGVRFAQLRIKNQPEAVVRKEIIRARDLCRAAGATLVINDYWQIAIEEGCDWLHLGQEDLVDADMQAIRAAGLHIGLSTHDREELERALSFSPDYIALGPIWPTILKKMKWHQQGPAKLTEWKDQIGDIPLVAIGGLSLDRAAEAFACGADVVSVVTDICLHPNPESQLKKWVEVTA
jgi:thiamine-phosphate pyrophosphorylase